MTGRAIFVSLILVLAAVPMTARANDRVPGRYVLAAVSEAASDGALWGWVERHQVLLAGTLAIIAASIGAAALVRTNARTLRANSVAAEEATHREAKILAASLAAEFEAASRACVTSQQGIDLINEELSPDLAVLRSVAMPPDTVAGTQIGKLGLLGYDIPEAIIRVRSDWLLVAQFLDVIVDRGRFADDDLLVDLFKGLLENLRDNTKLLAAALRAYPDKEQAFDILVGGKLLKPRPLTGQEDTDGKPDDDPD